jgi:hypothetical protein
MRILHVLLCCLLNAALYAGPFGFDLETKGESCAGLKDGSVRFKLTGGNVPITFQWLGAAGLSGNGEITISNPIVTVGNLGAGNYTFLFIDVVGRDTVIIVSITSPQPIQTSLSAEGDKCQGQNIGKISVDNVQGGVGPYKFSLNNAPPITNGYWDHLPPGNYFLSVIDAAGCRKEEAVVLPSGIEFSLDLGADTFIYSGDTLALTIQTNQPLTNLQWSPAAEVRNNPDGTVSFFPFFSTEFTLTATDPDGCVSSDELLVSVRLRRNIYVPNVFDPGAQAIENQTFTVFGSDGIKWVERLRVYDRDGRLWFENRNFPVNDPASGWDGAHQGDRAPTGVYLYEALIRLTDGRSEVRIGDVTLIR